MKRFIVFVFAALLASIYSLNVLPAKAATPVSSVTWSNPAMGGWSFGAADRIFTFRLTDPSLYEHVFRTDVIWYYGDGPTQQMHANWLEQNPDGSYTATFEIDADTPAQEGPIGIILRDDATGQPVVGAEDGLDNVDLYMAHGMNIRGMAGSAYASSSRADLTTDLSAVTDFRNLDLTVMCPSVGKIHFSNPIDVTGPAAMRGLLSVYKGIVAGNGRLGLNDNASSLFKQSAAQVTMYDLPHFFMPIVRYNGGDSSGIITNATYDMNGKTISFNTPHFSTYSVVPRVEIIDPANNNAKSQGEYYVVKGVVSDPAAVVKIYVGNEDQGDVTVNSDGTFNHEVRLMAGTNMITVKSSNAIGSGDDVVRYIDPPILAQTGMPIWSFPVLAAILLAGVSLAISRKKIA